MNDSILDMIDNNEIFLAPNRAEAAHGSGQPLVSVYADYAGRCEVLRLLLLLLIEPTSQNIRGATKLFFSIASWLRLRNCTK